MLMPAISLACPHLCSLLYQSSVIIAIKTTLNNDTVEDPPSGGVSSFLAVVHHSGTGSIDTVWGSGAR